MQEDEFIELVKFIEKEIIPKNKGMKVSDVLLSGEHYFKLNIYDYLKQRKDEYVLNDIKGFLKRVWC